MGFLQVAPDRMHSCTREDRGAVRSFCRSDAAPAWSRRQRARNSPSSREGGYRLRPSRTPIARPVWSRGDPEPRLPVPTPGHPRSAYSASRTDSHLPAPSRCEAWHLGSRPCLGGWPDENSRGSQRVGSVCSAQRNPFEDRADDVGAQFPFVRSAGYAHLEVLGRSK